MKGYLLYRWRGYLAVPKKTSLDERSFIERSLRLLKHTVKFVDGGGYLLKNSASSDWSQRM